MNQLPILIRVFAYLSILTVGGGMAAFPEMEHLTVSFRATPELQAAVTCIASASLHPVPTL